MNKNIHWFLGVLLGIGVLIIDRITKLYAVQYLQEPYYVTNFLSGHLVYNQGISWGIFNAVDGRNFMQVTLLVFAVTSLLIYYTYQRIRRGHAIYGELLVIAGSLSNMLDRIMYKGVVDFITFSYGRFAFPAFNVADCAIVLGVFIMLLQMAFEPVDA